MKIDMLDLSEPGGIVSFERPSLIEPAINIINIMNT